MAALISLCGSVAAQEYLPSHGKELPRSAVRVYSTAEEAATLSDGNNRYTRVLEKWENGDKTYTTEFSVPFSWINRQVFFSTEGASSDYRLLVNGKEAAYNHNGTAAAEYNITKMVHEGMNTLTLDFSPAASARLESWRTPDQLPVIGRCRILSQPTMHVRDFTVKTWRGNDNEQDTTALTEIALILKSHALNPRESRVWYEVVSNDGRRVSFGKQDLTLDMKREDTLRFLSHIPLCHLWSSEHPTCYTLKLKTQREGRYEEYMEYRLGLRTIEMKNGELHLNGAPARLKVTEVRPDISPREISSLKQQGYNTLRLLPGMTPESLYEVCDTMGMYVIATAPIDTSRHGLSRKKTGNPSNDPEWGEAYKERTEAAYHIAKRHPSVIAFSLARESANGINLYECYLDLKRLNDTRPILYIDNEGEWNSDTLHWEE